MVKEQRLKQIIKGLEQQVQMLCFKNFDQVVSYKYSIFKLVLDQIKIAQEEGGTEAITEIDKALRKVENALMREIEVSSDRVAMFEALKHLIVGEMFYCI